MFSIKVKITEEKLIAPYNHVHHAEIMYFLEKARVEFLSHIEQPLENLHLNGLLPVLRNMSVDYLREIKEGEYLITCEKPKVNKRELLLQQRAINIKKKDAVKASITLMIFSTKEGRAVYPPEDLKQAFDNLT